MKCSNLIGFYKVRGGKSISITGFTIPLVVEEKSPAFRLLKLNPDILSAFAIILPEICFPIAFLARKVCLDVSGPHFLQIENWGVFMPSLFFNALMESYKFHHKIVKIPPASGNI